MVALGLRKRGGGGGGICAEQHAFKFYYQH